MRRVGAQSGEHVVVRFIGTPVELYFAAQERVDGLLREFALIAIGNRTGVTEHQVPASLRALVDELESQYGDMAGDIRGAFEDAAAAGESTLDLELAMHPIGIEFSERFAEILDEADEFCRSGDLLTLAMPPDVVAWRRWWFGEVIGQGRERRDPVPYRGTLASEP